jgi:hypothetical protein
VLIYIYRLLFRAQYCIVATRTIHFNAMFNLYTIYLDLYDLVFESSSPWMPRATRI